MPVVLVQKAVRESNPAKLEILVDDPCAVENITRFASGRGYGVAVARQGDEATLTLTKKP